MNVKIGDKLAMLGVPLIVEVLELGECEDEDCDRLVFRFRDPEMLVDDWMHVDQFKPVD